jgi:dTMP kinase
VDRRGRLIALEGVDGCGKSTQARLLADELGALLTFEPGDSSIGNVLRQVLLDSPGSSLTPRAEALLMAADRAQHVAEVLEPALAGGRWVVSDRYSASTLAYQGYGRGLDLDVLRRVVDWATGGLEADLTVLVDVPLDLAFGRRRGVDTDRLERLRPEFHERVRQGYLALAEAAPSRWAVVDGSSTVAEVADAVRRTVTSRLGAPPAESQ